MATIQVTTIGISPEHASVASAIQMSGSNPVQVVCPSCHQHIVTQIQEELGVFTWIVFGVMFFFCPCCSCLPLCITQCKDLHHFCPNCKTLLGVKKPM